MEKPALKFYNTLSRQKEIFTPIDPNKVGLYSCGPTVYDYAHIGNMRSFILSDIVRRTLEWNDYEVSQVINITDVGHLTNDTEDTGEDKVERQAKASGQTVAELTKPFIDQFFQDLNSLNIKTTGTTFPKATEYITDQINLIKTLETKGFTYQTSDGIYFDTSKYEKYPELGHLNLDAQNKDSRHANSTEKKQPADFALWKFSDETTARLQEWESPWGIGFPGWHIECSAMSMKLLGNHIDIHTGGEDHVAVHHSNERAQSESATSEPFVNYWLHNAFITVGGKDKMAKSAGNFYTVTDLATKGWPALAYRYLVLTAHYRSPLNFSEESIIAAKNTLSNINQEIFSYPENGDILTDYLEKFTEYMNDDMGTPRAIALIHEILSTTFKTADKRATIEKFDEVLGILDENLINKTDDIIPEEIESLADDRDIARERGDWDQADLIRQQIELKGYTIKDTPNGRKISHID